MIPSDGTSRLRSSPSQLSYPNHTPDNMAGLAEVDINSSKDHKEEMVAYQPKRTLGLGRQVILVTCLMMGFLFSMVDTCIVAVPLVTISEEFGDFTHAPWVVLSYLLTYMGFATSVAQLSDIYGRRNILLFSWLVFVGFSMACGVAEDMTTLIVCRAFQGLGGSGLYSLTHVGIVEIGPGHRPSLVGAMMGGTLAFAFICGPLLGGVITDGATWRWIFNVNIPFGLVVIGIIVCCWPPEPQTANMFSWTASASIDFVGGLSLLCASGLLVYGLQQGGSQSSAWHDAEIVTALTFACASWILFVAWEYILTGKRFPHVQPIFPVRLASNRVFMAGLVVTLLTGFAIIPLTVIIPERFQIVHGDQPLTAGIHLLPMLGACAMGSFLSGAICSKRNFTCYILMAAAILQLVGLGLMSTLEDPDADVTASYGFQAIFGLGAGLVFSAATILAAVHSTRTANDLAVANGVSSQVRVLGGCVGISVCTIIFNAYFDAMLSEHLTEEQLDGLRRSPTASLTWDSESQEAVREVYATAYAEELRVMMYVVVATLVAAVFTFERNPTPVHQAVAVAKQRLEEEELSREKRDGDSDRDKDRKSGNDTERGGLRSLRST